MIDMHIHTTYSDGIFSPSQIISKAEEKGLETISFCDHNTVKAYFDLPKTDKLEIINGLEFYAYKKDISGLFHLLCYDYEMTNQLLDVMAMFAKKREENILCKLSAVKKEFNLYIDLDELDKTWLSDNSIRKYLILKYEKEYVDVIMKYIKQLHLKIDKKLPIEELLSIIKEAKGIPVLAHPQTIITDDMDKLISELKQLGLMGLEVYHSSHTKETIETLKKLVNKYDLLYSAGSDYHGFLKNDVNGLPIEIGNTQAKEDDIPSVLKYIRRRK